MTKRTDYLDSFFIDFNRLSVNINREFKSISFSLEKFTQQFSPKSPEGTCIAPFQGGGKNEDNT
jgi:hypothetical protein